MTTLPWRSLVAAASLAAALATASARSEPPATPPPGITVPDPSECRVAPRPVDDYGRLLSGTPVASPAPTRLMVPDALPTGRPADEETIAEVAALMRELPACGNADDTRRASALFTDAFILAGGPIDPATREEILAATPRPLPPAERVSVAGIRDVLVLDDGRVSAVVTLAGNTEDAHPAPGRTLLVFFARVGGRLLVDDMLDRIVPPGSGEFVWVADAVATPAAAAPSPDV